MSLFCRLSFRDLRRLTHCQQRNGLQLPSGEVLSVEPAHSNNEDQSHVYGRGDSSVANIAQEMRPTSTTALALSEHGYYGPAPIETTPNECDKAIDDEPEDDLDEFFASIE